ncbi:MAG: ABC transporter permease [Duodenibacillus sp.]|nr:ABC transporter permease [Duodenibacillus sp.]
MSNSEGNVKGKAEKSVRPTRVNAVRLRALIVKELAATLKERTSRMILVAPIILYVILFGYIATFNLDKVPYALLDNSRTAASMDFVRRIDASPVFDRIETLANTEGISRAIERGRALVVVAIDADFARDLADGRPARVQVIIDGRNSTTAQLAASYLSVMAQDYMAEKAGAAPAVTMRFLYNPNNITQWFIMPGLIVMLSMLQVIVLASLSVAREREQGTFEQLLVAPFSLDELVISKAIVPVAIGVFQSTLIFAIDAWWFEIPLAASVVKVYVVLLIFILSIVGLGLAISAYSRTMQQALLIAFVLLVPMVLLGGLFTPVANMPEWLQLLTYADPLRFALAAVRRIYLADAGYEEILLTMWPAIVVAAVTLPLARYYFGKRI